jgi:SAM-dependent methyltransferase
MTDWINNMFIENADIFLKILNYRWPQTEGMVEGIIKVLKQRGINSGTVLDLCCGNGRISIAMAKKGFKAVGVDISNAFIEDAKLKAKDHGVTHLVSFFEGDVRNLRTILDGKPRYDVVINAWTSLGFYTTEEDLNIFKQARELSKSEALLIVAETMHSEFLSIKFAPTSYMTIENTVLLEDRKYDSMRSQLVTTWTFYEKKRGGDLKYIDEVKFDLHIYSPSELCILLKKAGWETLTTYGSFTTLQPKTPLSGLNIVAKAQ